MRPRHAFVVASLLFACAPTPAPSDAHGTGAPPDAGDPERELEERIRAVVVIQRPRLRACYEDALAKNASLAGRVVLVLEVAQDGTAAHVFEARREGLGDDEIKCFVRVLKSARFHDGAARTMRIQVPLSFTGKE